ncbi:uncharacterized protein PHALS_02902 [Plasmopara halstedii]|uniref:RxLR-like protein n=1 Tax=Plasmopara halstedii TaxID=4781 RepID=A0A0P1AZX6_PLAHL|nr:uncharacterized protein PHALS_02902 [Plasmopara halstedii]CEG46502.1 hypothetical protein PHALS_02902 [Plasmopara halstedii]|eukprot:XP_024582871.1 hypothetical protein PHALS_02902 [Plasmopara halstedii]
MKTSTIVTMTATVLFGTSAAAQNVSTTGCMEVSVKDDATYCIQGPICSGPGLKPAGSQCPVKGDISSADCHSYLPSYSSTGICQLPVESTCQVIETGVWGCVLSFDVNTTNVTDIAADDIILNLVSLSTKPSSETTYIGETIFIASIAAGAACVAAVVGFALYKQHKKASENVDDITKFVDVVTP